MHGHLKQLSELTPANLEHVAELIRNTCRVSDNEWSGLISVFIREELGEGEQIVQRAQCGYCPWRVQIPRELCRVHLNASNTTFIAAVDFFPLRKLIEPFIVGVGNVRAEDTPEGFVIISSDDR